jgi:DNA polymerase-1
MKNCGFTEYESKSIFENYHTLYKESADWTARKLQECCELGYATVAFGLRVRTPVLARSILGNSATATISSSEARSVGNAISGQSYGLLNNRAAVAFMEKVWASEYRYDIFPVSLIHDAIYLMIKDDIHVLKWVNDNLIEEMSWQELPEIAHDKVKLEAELDLYHPSWKTPITLPNGLSTPDLKEHLSLALNK